LMVTIVEHSRSAEVVIEGLTDWIEALTGIVTETDSGGAAAMFWLLSLRSEGVAGND